MSDRLAGAHRPNSATSKRRVIAVVVNRNHRDNLKICLEHLGELEEPCLEIVVADDASTDGSAETVQRHFPLTHVVQAARPIGAAGARNLGITYATSRFEFDYVLFLDNDAFVEPTALTSLLDAAEQSVDVGVVAPKAYRSIKDRRLHLAGELAVNLYTGKVRDVGAEEIDHGQYDAPRRIAVCSGFTMLVHRRVLDRIGGFDDAFISAGWEDVDFCFRVGRAGYAILYAPAAIVEHVGGMRARGRLREREFAKARNWIVLMRRHATPLQWACFLAVLPLRSAGLALERSLAREPWAIAAQIGGLWRALRHSQKDRPGNL